MLLRMRLREKWKLSKNIAQISIKSPGRKINIREVQEAYETLSDEQKRRSHIGRKQRVPMVAGGGAGGFGVLMALVLVASKISFLALAVARTQLNVRGADDLGTG